MQFSLHKKNSNECNKYATEKLYIISIIIFIPKNVFSFREISRLKEIHDVIKIKQFVTHFALLSTPTSFTIYSLESAPSLSKYRRKYINPGKWKRKLMENLLINLRKKIVCCCKKEIYKGNLSLYSGNIIMLFMTSNKT